MLLQGITRLLLTKIPFYKEVVLMSFSCDHCGFSNNELQSGATIEPKGKRMVLKVKDAKDLNRRIVKSDHTSVKFVEIDFEIPAQSQKGEVTTLEGIIDRSITGLEQDQPVRRIEHPEVAKSIDEFVDKLKDLKLVNKSFTIVLDDITGNCFIENLNAPHTDPACVTTYFARTSVQDHSLGIYSKSEIEKSQNDSTLHPIAEDSWKLEELHGEVLQFKTLCPECQSACETNMKVTTIPHFKDVVIMATVCDNCGNKTNEVKSGAGIEDEGVRFEVRISGYDDMSRDVLKVYVCYSKYISRRNNNDE